MSNQPMSAREKMEMAKQLIQQKRYNEARTILRTVNHDKAYEWLTKLDQLDPPKGSNKGALSGLIAGLVGIVLLIIVGGIVYTQRTKIPGLARLFVSPTPTATLTPSVTSIPTMTATETATLTPIATNTPKPTNAPLKTSTSMLAPTIASATTAMPQAIGNGKWQVTKKPSSLGEAIFVTLEAETEVSSQNITARPAIIIRCVASTLDLLISAGIPIEEVEVDSYTAQFTLGFDKIPAEPYEAELTPDKQFIYSENARAMINLMLPHETMTFEFTSVNSIPVNTTFDLGGISYAIEPAYEACGIR
jgi:hypothetical protein